MSISKVIAHAWTDPEFKDKLVSDPRATLAEYGVAVPAGKAVKVIENSADTVHLLLPTTPSSVGKVSVEDLESIAGGYLSTQVTDMNDN